MRFSGNYKGEPFLVEIGTAVDGAGQPYAACDDHGVYAAARTEQAALASVKAKLETRLGCTLAPLPKCDRCLREAPSSQLAIPHSGWCLQEIEKEKEEENNRAREAVAREQERAIEAAAASESRRLEQRLRECRTYTGGYSRHPCEANGYCWVCGRTQMEHVERY